MQCSSELEGTRNAVACRDSLLHTIQLLGSSSWSSHAADPEPCLLYLSCCVLTSCPTASICELTINTGINL
jgi:hypothetical protein